MNKIKIESFHITLFKNHHLLILLDHPQIIKSFLRRESIIIQVKNLH
jgi:hypothetical protein